MRDNIFQHKLQARTVFLSDLHLGSRACHAGALLEFLERVTPGAVYLLGDVVDLESLKRGLYWPEAHMAVVRRLIGLARAGVPVTYIPGNHDAEVREFVGTHFAEIEIHGERVHVTADGRRLLVVHGDEFDSEAATSPWLRVFGAHAYDATLALSKCLSAARRRLGLSHWSLVAYLKTRVATSLAHIDRFERAAALGARRRGMDGIVCGHIHHPRIGTVDGILYCNDGDWVESCSALIEDAQGRLALWHAAGWDTAAAFAPSLPALDRAA